ncbi:uncharacterized protein LOC135209076 [Macrobrachium nipponense]|uniref:uncharacterized protein LOC135209076 n=1 Tax=Macrobrachium nipponense TaxID=159736 RepID=UPI0030C831BC
MGVGVLKWCTAGVFCCLILAQVASTVPTPPDYDAALSDMYELLSHGVERRGAAGWTAVYATEIRQEGRRRRKHKGPGSRCPRGQSLRSDSATAREPSTRPSPSLITNWCGRTAPRPSDCDSGREPLLITYRTTPTTLLISFAKIGPPPSDSASAKETSHTDRTKKHQLPATSSRDRPNKK